MSSPIRIAPTPPVCETVVLIDDVGTATVMDNRSGATVMAATPLGLTPDLAASAVNALDGVIANARFTGSRITIEQVKRALRDLLAIQDRQVSIDNIQRTVAEYYNIKISDILSKRRTRTIARPRQMAMALAKELTNHSLPEIGEAFGGRDHTTVLHACRKIAELRESNTDVSEDYKNLSRLLAS